MKPIIKLVCLAAIFLGTSEIKAQKLNLLIGTYTSPGKSEGIYVYEFDDKTGKAGYKNKVSGIENPSYLAISSNKNFVYAVNEAGPGKGGVSAFTFDGKTGTLKLLGKTSSEGNGPCYVAVNKSSDHVFAGNYGGGNFSVLPVLENGSLGKAVQVIQHTGSSADKSRQDKPHVHSTIFSPDEKILFVSDLGTDKIMAYSYNKDNKSQPLTENKQATATVGAGSGPRHLAFSRDGKFAYSIQEMTGNITVFRYTGSKMETVQNISMLAEGFKGDTGAADIHVSPDGKFLYSTNRGDANEIAIFSIDEKTGMLKLTGRHPSMGTGPRNFVISPSGNYLLVGNQKSDTVIILRRDKKTGMLNDTGERINVGSPVCLKFP